MTAYILDIPVRKPTMTANEQRRATWLKIRSAKSQVGSDVGWYAKAAKLPHFTGPVRVTVTWWAPNARRRDPDCLGPWCKAALDGLVAAGVLVDDDSTHVLSVTQEIRIDRANPHITITLEPEIAA